MVIEPFFTILTASLNSGATLRRTLVSVAEQTCCNLEHIVLDGGSWDQTVEILGEFNKQYNLHWVSEPDSGIAEALNKGVIRGKGKYFLVLQADDWFWDREVLTKVHPLLQDESIDIYSFPVKVEQQGGGLVPYRPFKILWWHHFKTIIPHQGAFVHRRVFERIGVYCEELKIAFDYDFFYRALQAHCILKYGQTPVAVMGGGGISSKQDLLTLRLMEESQVQRRNEKNLLWRIAQAFFRTLYVPYKTQVAPYWLHHVRKPGKSSEVRMQDGKAHGRRQGR